MPERTAFVTGASRGIGRACSVSLARAGYDVAIAARTLREGSGRAQGPYSTRAEEVSVPGSLEATAAEVEKCGTRALAVQLDLLDRESLTAAVRRVLDEWGRIDLLLNNGIYAGPGLLDRIADLPLAQLETILMGNVVHQLHLTQLVLEPMLARGSGVIMNMTSSAGQVEDPPFQLVELGMLGFAHCASKGAFHRMVPLLHAEHSAQGIRAYNIDPGFTRTDTMQALGLPLEGAMAPEVTAAVVAWLATQPEAEQWSGKTVDTKKLCRQLRLRVSSE